jgi:prepilin-type N-terminal cleavage/methylation domain-containing protein
MDEQTTMRHPQHARVRQRGFTILELLVAAVMVGLAAVFIGEIFTQQNRAHVVVENVTETQQSVRALGDMLERDLRVTGFLVPEEMAFCGIDTAALPDTAPDVLFLTDADALGDAIAPNNVPALGVAARVLNGSSIDGRNNGESLILDTLAPDGVPFYDLSGNGVADSDFLFIPAPLRAGGVILWDRANPAAGVACGIIRGIGGTTLTVDFNPGGVGAARNTALGNPSSDILAVPAHVYRIDGTRLLRNEMLLAEDVEDLQFAAFFDVNGDGIVNCPGGPCAGPPFVSTLEYPGSEGSVYRADAWDHADLRELRVTIVGRTRAPDPQALNNADMARGTMQFQENRTPPPGGVAPDGFRRRVMVLTAAVRNVGGRELGG